MSEDKIEFAKDLVASNISKANKEESSSLNNDDISTIKETNHTIRQIERKRAEKAARRIQQTSMQTILSAEHDVLLRAAKRRTIRTSTLAWTSTEKLTLSSIPSTGFSIWMPCMMDISIHGTLLRVVKRNALRNF